MSSFLYECEEQKLYLFYKTDQEETINEEIVKKFTEKKREGIVSTEYIISSEEKYFKYDVSSTITLNQLLLNGVDEKVYCSILQSVVLTVERLLEEGIGTRELVLNENLIYYDLIEQSVKFIVIPSSYYICNLAPNQILYEFSKLIISRMGVTDNLNLEINEYLENRVFDFDEFKSMLKGSLNDTDQNNNESQETTGDQNNVKEITNNAKKIFFDKVNNIKEALENIKTNKQNKEAGIYNIVNMPIGNTTYEEAIRSEVAQQKENDRKRMEDIKSNFDNNRIFNNQIVNREDGNGQNITVIIDCVDGSVTDGNSVNTSNPYLLRKSTGEKIYINSNNCKIGRSKKFVDYYVGGNDTISKVHAYITTDATYYYISDNSSRNHTYVDGTKLEPVKKMELKHKSNIRLAKEEFEFYLY